MSGGAFAAMLEALHVELRRDGRVVALFVTGSHADGRADEHSDLDLLAVTDEGDVGALSEHLPSLVHEIEPLVDAASRPLGATTRLVNLVTARCQRIDVLVTSPAEVARAPRFGAVRPLFDRAGVEATLPPVSDPPAVAHDEAWFDALVKRVLRTAALLPMLVARGESIRGAQHVQLLKQDHLELLLFAEGDPPIDRPGAWAWSQLNHRLSSERRRQVEALPPAAMTAAEVVDVHLAVVDAFLGVAKQVAHRRGFVWKHAAYERAVTEYLQRSAHVGLPDSPDPPGGT